MCVCVCVFSHESANSCPFCTGAQSPRGLGQRAFFAVQSAGFFILIQQARPGKAAEGDLSKAHNLSFGMPSGVTEVSNYKLF